MSTTSEVSSHSTDFTEYQTVIGYQQATPMMANSLAGVFYPLPSSNAFYNSPLFYPYWNSKDCYDSVKDVIEHYQELLRFRYYELFPETSGLPAPSLSTRLDFLWVGYSQELFQLLAERFGFQWQLVLCVDLHSDKGVRVPKTFPMGFEPLAYPDGGNVFASDTTTAYSDKAKVRFRCGHCQKAWTSMRGPVDFRFVSMPNNAQQGIVFFRLYNQQCQSCLEEVTVLWFDDEIVRVLTNLYFYMARTFHNAEWVKQPIADSPKGRGGCPKQGHLKQLCEACREGGCKNRSASASSSRRPSPSTTPAPLTNCQNSPQARNPSESCQHHSPNPKTSHRSWNNSSKNQRRCLSSSSSNSQFS